MVSGSLHDTNAQVLTLIDQVSKECGSPIHG